MGVTVVKVSEVLRVQIRLWQLLVISSFATVRFMAAHDIDQYSRMRNIMRKFNLH